MREIEIGIRYDLKTPPTFFGLNEVNAQLKQGATVIAIEPGGVIARKLGNVGEDVQLTISGFSVKVKIRDAGEPASTD